MSFLNLTSAARTSLSLASLIVLTACGGGGGGDSGPAPVNTADLNPSLTASTLPAALPNATKLVAASFTGTLGVDGSFSTTVGASTYTYDLMSFGIDLTGDTDANYVMWEEGRGGFLMLCRKGTPSKAEAVFAAPYLATAVPAKPEELAGKSFEEVDGCDADENNLPLIEYRNDGTAVSTEGSTTLTLSKADLAKYFSDLGVKDGNDVYRGHAYKVTDGSITAYMIIETFRESGQDGIAMYLQAAD